MVGLQLAFCMAVSMQPGDKAPEAALDVQAERGIGGMQSEGWQHVAIELRNAGPETIIGRATLYEWESQGGPRPRLVLPFAVTDRQVLHFYSFRPPDSPLAGPYLITLDDESGRPLSFRGAEQSVVLDGRSRRAVRVTTGDEPVGNYRVGLWGESIAPMTKLVDDWDLTVDKLHVDQLGARDWNRISSSAQQLQRIMGGQYGHWNAQAVPLERPRLFPDSYVGYTGLDALMLFGADLDRELTEPQRRALADWVRSGGSLIFAPSKTEQLHSTFWSELAGIKPIEIVTAEDDRHLQRWIGEASIAARQHQPIHFLTAVEPPRPRETLVEYESQPVVYSVAAGYGRVWLVGFDPEAHGGLKRYAALWTEILNQAVRHRIADQSPPVSPSAQGWTFDADHEWLKSLGKRFGNYPTVESLAMLIVLYLVVVGPVNYLVLKRREMRVWFIASVPCLSVAFGGVVLGLGFYTHGVRAATNQMALAVVTPEGDRAFVDEFIGVYGNTSDVYRVGLPRHLPVRPLGEFVAKQGGGYENPTNFQLDWRNDRMWLADWRLSFWQTRGIASTDSVASGGLLQAAWDGDAIRLTNRTPIEFQSVALLRRGMRQSVGGLKPFQTREFRVLPSSPGEVSLADDSESAAIANRSQRATGAPAGSAPDAVSSVAVAPTQTDGSTSDRSDSTDLEVFWPEAERLLNAAVRRLGTPDRDWMLGVTRQPVHTIDSPDARNHLVATVYAWPVQGAAPKERRVVRFRSEARSDCTVPDCAAYRPLGCGDHL